MDSLRWSAPALGPAAVTSWPPWLKQCRTRSEESRAHAQAGDKRRRWWMPSTRSGRNDPGLELDRRSAPLDPGARAPLARLPLGGLPPGRFDLAFVGRSR